MCAEWHRSMTIGPAETIIRLSGRVVTKANEVAGALLECALAQCCSLASCFAMVGLLLLLASLLLLQRPILPLLLLLLELWFPGLCLTVLILCAWSCDFFLPDWCCCQATSAICSMSARIGRHGIPSTPDICTLCTRTWLSVWVCVLACLYSSSGVNAEHWT